MLRSLSLSPSGFFVLAVPVIVCALVTIVLLQPSEGEIAGVQWSALGYMDTGVADNQGMAGHLSDDVQSILGHRLETRHEHSALNNFNSM